ncbi:hypothetical protein VQ042_12800 [Aurantimonas sp. A2-1-M11]|uniref:COG4223 family protein n=1 Tax=Aurantimonas sp. A2-1-M11 TaxID=3113712 RepID=UPI002F94CE1F
MQDLSGELAALREQVSALPATPADDEGAQALTARVDALEQAAAAPADDSAATAAEAASQAAESATQTANAAQQSADQAGQTASAAQETATTAQETATAAEAAATQAQEAAAAAQSSADSANEAASAAQETASGAQDGVTAINETLSDIDSRIAAVEARNLQASQAFAAANLKSAIDTGGPFMQQLENYAQIAGGEGATEELRALAADGVPTEQELASRWPDVEDRIAAQLTPVAPDAPVGDQLLSGLRSLVQVRPVEPSASATPGEGGPNASLARLDAAIGAGDLAGWTEEWQTLPEAARTASQDFADQVEARLTADRVIADALASATAPAPPAAQDNQG